MNNQGMIEEVSIDRLRQLWPQAPTVYDSREFCMLNAGRADRVTAYLLRDSDGTPLCGQIFGEKDGLLCAPFSAPFSLPSGEPESFARFYRLIQAFTGKRLKLAWAPDCYDVAAPEVGEAMLTAGPTEANFHYPMARVSEYKKYLSRSARYNLNRAQRENFQFRKSDDVAGAYRIILANRQAMGYPLAMTLGQVEATVNCIEADFFVLSHEGIDMAAAMVYRVRPDVAQLIYWGDLPQFRALKGMNLLAYKVVEWYRTHKPEIEIFDVGPASSAGVRNEGLCEFKKSIGCVETAKHLFR